MKQITFFLLVLSMLFVACRKRCTCKGYSVDQNPCGCILFQDKIGNDFDLALDSLSRRYESKFIELEATRHYSGKGYFVEKERINVDFTNDNRAFFHVTFIDSFIINGHLTNSHLNSFDVLDEKGNYYIYREGRKD